MVKVDGREIISTLGTVFTFTLALSAKGWHQGKAGAHFNTQTLTLSSGAAETKYIYKQLKKCPWRPSKISVSFWPQVKSQQSQY